jgi:hypothetical protein
MYEAVDNFGMKYAVWVKYPPSLFHYNYFSGDIGNAKVRGSHCFQQLK